jgi:O-antigen biosynthesis protein
MDLQLNSQPVEISVVVATYDRPEALARCLRSLVTQQTTRAFEIIVVDNHPQSRVTSTLIDQFPSVRWLEEVTQGLSMARNCGIRAAQGSVIVTTDDDVVASPQWMEILTRPLFESDHSPVATTGNCLPWKVETEAEALFEAYGGLRHGDHRADYDAGWMARWRICFPQLWRIGTTANSAFRASLFRESPVGLFETRLGAGTPAGAWEDLYCFYRILRAGHGISYIPEAHVLHAHREGTDGLARQLCNYRRGETAFLTLVLIQHRDWRTLGQVFLWIPWWRFTLVCGELLRRLSGSRKYSFTLFWMESMAYLAGPWSLWAAHRMNRATSRTGATIP